jgi:hypothetical protein
MCSITQVAPEDLAMTLVRICGSTPNASPMRNASATDQGRARDQVVAELGDLARPDRADMDDVGAHGSQRRPGFFQIAGIAADHDRKCAGRGAAHPARNRRIEEPQATFLEASRHPLRGTGIDRRHVDAEPPSGGALDDPALAEIGGLDIGRGRQHRNYEVAIRRRFTRRPCPPRTQPYRNVQRARHDIEGDDLEALLDEVGQHRLPHRPGPDESDLHRFTLLKSPDIHHRPSLCCR